MKKESIAAAVRELEWAVESWRAVQVIWSRELTQTWNDFNRTIDNNVSKNLRDATPAYSAFVDGSQNGHTTHNLSEARRAWSAFLTHANRVFSKLQQGAKVGSSQPWYGTVIHARKTDPLLQYIHQARDASEHGDTLLSNDTVVERKAPNVCLLVTPEALATGSGNSGGTMDIPMLLLLPAKTRAGVFMPPTKHLGQEIRPSIEIVAEAILAYLGQIVVEAKLRAG